MYVRTTSAMVVVTNGTYVIRAQHNARNTYVRTHNIVYVRSYTYVQVSSDTGDLYSVVAEFSRVWEVLRHTRCLCIKLHASLDKRKIFG